MRKIYKTDKFHKVNEALLFTDFHPISNMILRTQDSIMEVSHSAIRIRTGEDTDNPEYHEYPRDIPVDDLNRVCRGLLETFHKSFPDDAPGSYHVQFNTESPFADRR